MGSMYIYLSEKFPVFSDCTILCSVVSDCSPMDCSPPGSSIHGDSLGKNTGVGCHALPLQGNFPTQGSNPGLPHCKWIHYRLSHQGSPRILEWVSYLFSRGSSWPRNRTRVSCIAGEGNGSPVQNSGLENPMDRGPWQAIVCGLTKSQTWLSG